MRVLFVGRVPGNSVLTQADSVRDLGIAVDWFVIEGGLIGYLRSVRRLRDVLRGANYDVIHAHYGLSGVIAQLARGPEKLVVSFMGTDALCPVDARGRATMLGGVLVKASTLLVDRYDAVIAKSEGIKEALPRSARATVIPNGVDFDVFKPEPTADARARFGIAGDTKLVIFVGDPKRTEKNFALAKRAVDAMRDAQVDLAVVQGVDQETLCTYYNAASCLLLTSFHEGSPNVIKEAMACNCPVVSTPVGDVSDVVGRTGGCYCSTFDPEGLADQLRAACSREGDTRGRQMIAYLEKGQIARRIAAVYEELVSDSKRGA